MLPLAKPPGPLFTVQRDRRRVGGHRVAVRVLDDNGDTRIEDLAGRSNDRGVRDEVAGRATPVALIVTGVEMLLVSEGPLAIKCAPHAAEDQIAECGDTIDGRSSERAAAAKPAGPLATAKVIEALDARCWPDAS